MNAQPSDLQQQAQQLSASVTRPIAGSRKIHVAGSRPDLRVPMREIALTRTPTLFGGEANPPLAVYDTSGAYTDADAHIDLTTGLPALRRAWIEERGDTEQLDALSSRFGREREHDPKLDAVRFPARSLPRRAQAGANVTQMHYARRGIITPEMEFVAIREGMPADVWLLEGADPNATEFSVPTRLFDDSRRARREGRAGRLDAVEAFEDLQLRNAYYRNAKLGGP